MGGSLSGSVGCRVTGALLRGSRGVRKFSLRAITRMYGMTPSAVGHFYGEVNFEGFSDLEGSMVGCKTSLRGGSATLDNSDFVTRLGRGIRVVRGVPGRRVRQVMGRVDGSHEIIVLNFRRGRVRTLRLRGGVLLTKGFYRYGAGVFGRVSTLSVLARRSVVVAVSVRKCLLSRRFLLFRGLGGAGKGGLLVAFSRPRRRLRLFSRVLRYKGVRGDTIDDRALLELFSMLFR